MKNIEQKDHGLNYGQWETILKNLATNPPSGFFLRAVKLLDGSSIPNALYGPEEGDEPVPKNAVVYLRRRGRQYNTRLIADVKKVKRPCNTIQVTGMIRVDGTMTIYTAYAGTVTTPREPGNPDILTATERSAAEKFWATHALAQDGLDFLPPVDFEAVITEKHPNYWTTAKSEFPELYIKAMKEVIDNELRVERGEPRANCPTRQKLTAALHSPKDDFASW